MLDGNAQEGILDKVNQAPINAGKADYGVRFYPTQVALRNGEAVAMHEGKFNSEEEFLSWVKNSLGKP